MRKNQKKRRDGKRSFAFFFTWKVIKNFPPFHSDGGTFSHCYQIVYTDFSFHWVTTILFELKFSFGEKFGGKYEWIRLAVWLAIKKIIFYNSNVFYSQYKASLVYSWYIELNLKIKN